jgi:lysozyme
MAHLINRLVVDLSHHQPATDYEAAKRDGIIGVIYKATEGAGYKDPTYHEQRTMALNAGMLWGAYHFGNNDPVDRQIENFIEYAQIREGELFCLDFEDNRGKSMSLDAAKLWVIGVEEVLRRVGECVLYSGNWIKKELVNRIDKWWAARRLWLAQYGPTPKCPPTWEKYWLWQYTGDGDGPGPQDVAGIGRGLDCNSYDGTKEMLAAEWASGWKEDEEKVSS